MNRATKITVEYEDGTKHVIKDQAAVVMQVRINQAGVMAGIEVEEEKGE